jgi:phage terminase Nu1 subunit (DNA packaging protein)
MDPVIVKEYKPRMKDKSLTNHWTLYARKYTSVQAEYYRHNVEKIQEKNRLRYANNSEVRVINRERSRLAREQKKRNKSLEEKNCIA